MTTIKSLMNQVGCQQTSVSMGSSRTVLGYLESDLLGYGLAFSGFVAIYNTKRGAKAVSYTLKRTPWDNQGNFSDMSVDDAFNLIKSGNLMAEKMLPDVCPESMHGKLIGQVKLSGKQSGWRAGAGSYDIEMTYRLYSKTKGKRTKYIATKTTRNSRRSAGFIPMEDKITMRGLASVMIDPQSVNKLEDRDDYKDLKVVSNTIPEDIKQEVIKLAAIEEV